MVDIKLKLDLNEKISRKTADILIQIIEAQVTEPAAKPRKARAPKKAKKSSPQKKSDFDKSEPKPGMKVLKNAQSGSKRKKTHSKPIALGLAAEMDAGKQGASGRPPKYSFVQWVTWAYESASVAAIRTQASASKQTVLKKLSQITDSTGIGFQFVKD